MSGRRSRVQNQSVGGAGQVSDCAAVPAEPPVDVQGTPCECAAALQPAPEAGTELAAADAANGPD
eukprot:7272188-Prymnesium_polylepis.1